MYMYLPLSDLKVATHFLASSLNGLYAFSFASSTEPTITTPRTENISKQDSR